MLKRGDSKRPGTKQKLSFISISLRPCDHKMTLVGSATKAQQILEQDLQDQMSKVARDKHTGNVFTI